MQLLPVHDNLAKCRLHFGPSEARRQAMDRHLTPRSTSFESREVVFQYNELLETDTGLHTRHGYQQLGRWIVTTSADVMDNAILKTLTAEF